MKETKFAAFNKKTKKWFGRNWLEYVAVGFDCVFFIKYKPNGSGSYDPEWTKRLTNPEMNEWEIVQFTGLHDSQNKEIYEGDIMYFSWAYAGVPIFAEVKKDESGEFVCIDINNERYNYYKMKNNISKCVKSNIFEDNDFMDREKFNKEIKLKEKDNK